MIADFPYGSQDGGISPEGRRPRLLVLTDMAGTGKITTAADAAGLCLLKMIELEDAPFPIDIPPGCDIILLSCVTPGPMLEPALVQVETHAIQHGIPVIAVAGIDTVDLAYACIRGDRTQLLCQPDATDLAAALIAAGNALKTAPNVHEADEDDDRLRKLSDDVSRLARTLEKLAGEQRRAAPSFDLGPRISDRASDYIGLPASPPGEEFGRDQHGDAITAQQVRDLLRARRLRDEFLPGDLFADPAWDMLLDLFAARLEQERVSVSSLCIASAVPPTTALRWIRTLTDNALLQRQADPYDGRRIFIALTDSAANALTGWFHAGRRFLSQ